MALDIDPSFVIAAKVGEIYLKIYEQNQFDICRMFKNNFETLLLSIKIGAYVTKNISDRCFCR
jgi:hypothetical protein